MNFQTAEIPLIPVLVPFETFQQPFQKAWRLIETRNTKVKKLAIMFVPLVLVLQLPVCPYRYLPQDWVNTYEYGKKWTHVLVSLYLESFTKSVEAAKQAHEGPQDGDVPVVRVRLQMDPAPGRVETQVRILRFVVPREEDSLQFRTRCERL